jgi:hypothetical protein
MQQSGTNKVAGQTVLSKTDLTLSIWKMALDGRWKKISLCQQKTRSFLN